MKPDASVACHRSPASFKLGIVGEIGAWQVPKRQSGFPSTRVSLLGRLADNGSCQSAWNSFFERYAIPVYRVARSRGLDTHDAEDIVQYVMSIASRRLGAFEYDPRRGRFRAWMRTVTENKIREVARRRVLPVDKSVMLDERPGNALSSEEIWTREWQMRDLMDALDRVSNRITERKMHAFRLFFLQEIPARDVALRLGMTIAQVYVSRQLVLNLLRKELNG
jgi:RNA polymerase sigma factor (sigma-70 family)